MVPVDVEAFSALVERVYAAGLDPSLWPDFLEAFDRELDGAYLAMHGYDTRSEVSFVASVARFPDEMVAVFRDHYCHRNPFTPAFLKLPEMSVRASEELVERDQLLQSEFYNDFLAKQERIGTGGGGLLYNRAGRMLQLTAQIRLCDEDTKVPQFIRLLNLLMPHIQQAFSLHRRLALSGAIASARSELLDRASSAAFLLDDRQRLLWCNAAAETMQASAMPVAIARDGTLGFRDAATQRRFDTGWKRLLYGEAAEAVAPFPAAGREGCYVSLMPVPREVFGWLPGGPTALVVLSDPRPVPNALWPVHAAQLGLTVAEQALAEALVAGQSLAVFAEARDRSLHTVRAQLKALLAKTGTNGQTEMVAKLAPYFH